MRAYRLIIRKASVVGEAFYHVQYEELVNRKENTWKVLRESIVKPKAQTLIIAVGDITVNVTEMISDDSYGLWTEISSLSGYYDKTSFIPWGNVWGEQSKRANKIDIPFFAD